MSVSAFGVRNEREWHRIKVYIENNPVKAGMVREARDYPWSSAAGQQTPGLETSLEAANRSVHATTGK